MAFGRRIRAWWKRVTVRVPKMGHALGYWTGGPVVILELSPSVTPDQRRCLQVAMVWWNKQCHDIFAWREGGLAAEIGFPPRTGVVTVTSHPPVGGPHVQATAELFFVAQRGGPIRAAHIEVRPDIQGDVAARAIAHEMGHVLGLGHAIDAEGYLMGPNSDGWKILTEELTYIMIKRG